MSINKIHKHIINKLKQARDPLSRMLFISHTATDCKSTEREDEIKR